MNTPYRSHTQYWIDSIELAMYIQYEFSLKYLYILACVMRCILVWVTAPQPIRIFVCEQRFCFKLNVTQISSVRCAGYYASRIQYSPTALIDVQAWCTREITQMRHIQKLVQLTSAIRKNVISYNYWRQLYTNNEKI